MNGILFKDEMVRPILNTKPDVWPAVALDESKPFKWQTRRRFPLVKDRWYPEMRAQEHDGVFSLYNVNSGSSALPEAFAKPRYKLGSICYVRETHGIHRSFKQYHSSEIGIGHIHYTADDSGCPRTLVDRLRPSIHLNHRHARLWVKVMNIRIERVKDISEADAKAEGCTGDCPVGYIPAHQKAPLSYEYAQLYDSINGAGSFDNDWCFAYDFQRVSKP